jgi:hypothetical protein
MEYNVAHAVDILSRTPAVLRDLLGGLPPVWVRANEGPGTWSPFDVVGHLIHGERTDWIPRAEIILGASGDKRFAPFVRDAMMGRDAGKSLDGLLGEFAVLRAESIRRLEAFGLDESKLSMTGIHPEFGEVTLRQHLATWVAHDLSHISQVVRVLAGQYKGEVGPWVKYLSILR